LSGTDVILIKRTHAPMSAQGERYCLMQKVACGAFCALAKGATFAALCMR